MEIVVSRNTLSQRQAIDVVQRYTGATRVEARKELRKISQGMGQREKAGEKHCWYPEHLIYRHLWRKFPENVPKRCFESYYEALRKQTDCVAYVEFDFKAAAGLAHIVLDVGLQRGNHVTQNLSPDDARRLGRSLLDAAEVADRSYHDPETDKVMKLVEVPVSDMTNSVDLSDVRLLWALGHINPSSDRDAEPPFRIGET